MATTLTLGTGGPNTMDRTEKQRRVVFVVRWIARAWSIASIGLVLGFLVGEGFHPEQLTTAQRLGFVFFPVGICLGMILAWWKELLGGSITVGSLLVFYAVHLASAGTPPKGWAWIAFAVPGFLFVLCWYRSRKATASAV
jgi:hypothetical protein